VIVLSCRIVATASEALLCGDNRASLADTGRQIAVVRHSGDTRVNTITWLSVLN